METNLDQENKLVLDVVQAALGLISREMNAISVRIESGQISLYVAVCQRSEEVDEDVEDLVFELSALRDGHMPIKAYIYAGVPNADWPGSSGRRVYVAKEA